MCSCCLDLSLGGEDENTADTARTTNRWRTWLGFSYWFWLFDWNGMKLELFGILRSAWCTGQVGSSKIWRPIWVCLKLWTMAHQHPLAITGLSWSSLSKLTKWGKPWNAPFWNITNPFVWHILILNFWRSYCSKRLCTKAIPCCAEAQWGHLQRPANSWPC